MNIDIQKAKHALATLQEEKRAQNDRLQFAVQAKQHLDPTIASRTQLPISNRVLGGRNFATLLLLVEERLSIKKG